MSQTSSSRNVIVALSIALGFALVLIAFLLGRESARRVEAVSIAEAPSPPAAEPVAEPVAEPWRWPEVKETKEVIVAPEPQKSIVSGVGAGRIERRPDGTILLSNRRRVAAAPKGRPGGTAGAATSKSHLRGTAGAATSKSHLRGPAEATTSKGLPRGAAETAYFEQIDRIQTEEGAGDPNVFAMGLIKAAMNGSTSGFDRLIDDTKRMEQEMRGVTPPPSCESYHESSLEALSEGREILESLKRSIADRDFTQLNTIALQAGSLQRKMQTLKTQREQILNARMIN